jgi:transcriptional regulator with XRE-family HTH domain
MATREGVAMDLKQFGGRLRELREHAVLTQAQLGEAAGVQRLAIARWEAGTREPGWLNVLALCKALGVSCEEFTKEPAEREPPGPGRPRKTEVPCPSGQPRC